MYESVFSYNVTKPYPYRWFTWVVVLGGIAAAALFSMVSVAANGFETATLYVSNPNDTEHPSQLEWFQKRPWSLASKIVPKCQDETMSVGSQIFTNNFILPYLIAAANKMHPNKVGPVLSFAYHNDPLHDCWIPGFSVDVVRGDYDLFTVNASVQINCTVFDNHLPVTVLLTTIFDDGSNHPWPSVTFDNSTQSSLWWGLTLLFDQYGNFGLFSDFSASYNWLYIFEDGAETRRSYTSMDITNNNITTSIHSQFTSLKSWSSSFGPNVLAQFVMDLSNSTSIPFGKISWNASDTNIAGPVFLDSLAKSIYAFVLTDLGQVTEPNFLADPQGIWSYLNATKETFPSTQYILSDGLSLTSGDNLPGYSFDDPANQDPATLFTWAHLGLPHVNDTSISMDYLCQVPKQKPTGSLIYSVVVAELVFLQALWTVFTWIVKTVLDRQNPAANFCSGCMKAMTEVDSVETVAPVLVTKHADLPQDSPSPALLSGVDSPTIRRRPVSTPASLAAQEQDEITVQLLEPDRRRTA